MSAATPSARRPRPASGSDMCLVAIGDIEQITLLIPTADALALAKLLARCSEVERDWKNAPPLEQRYYVRQAVARFAVRNVFPEEIVDQPQAATRKARATTPPIERDPKCPA